jgi:hypothetical protein
MLTGEGLSFFDTPGGSKRKVLVRDQEQQIATCDLDRVTDKHYMFFCHGIRESSDEGRENHVKQNERELEHRSEISRLAAPTRRLQSPNEMQGQQIGG